MPAGVRSTPPQQRRQTVRWISSHDTRCFFESRDAQETSRKEVIPKPGKDLEQKRDTLQLTTPVLIKVRGRDLATWKTVSISGGARESWTARMNSLPTAKHGLYWSIIWLGVLHNDWKHLTTLNHYMLSAISHHSASCRQYLHIHQTEHDTGPTPTMIWNPHSPNHHKAKWTHAPNENGILPSDCDNIW